MSPTRTSAIALASLAISASAAAQCGYQSGTPQCFSFAPPPPEIGNISEDLQLRSDKLTLSGDIRFRTRNAQAPSSAPYNEADQVASRARVNLDYQFTEQTSAFVQFNFSEVWPGSEGYSDAVPGNDYNGIAQAYMLAEDLFGAGEVVRIGRSYYTVASGLIYGSCDFLQFPASGTGVWLSREFGAHKLELFGIDNNGTITTNGLGNDIADGQRFVGAHARIDLGNELVAALEPYVLFGTGDGDRFNPALGNPDFTNDSWFGLAAMGKLDRFSWNGEIAQRNDDVPTGADNTFVGYRVNVLADTGDLTGNVLNRVRLTRTDAEGRLHINPGDFNSAGLLHQYGGAWRSDLSTDQLGLTFKPTETLTIDLAYLYMDTPIPSGGEHEVDLMIAKKLRDGAFGWVGYGRDEDDREVLFVQLTVFF